MKVTSVFTPAQAEILAGLHGRDANERRDRARNAHSLMAVAPEVAELLYLLVVQKGARRIVEFGTSHGYSTLHLAAAAERTDGRVFSVDAMPEKTAIATRHLEAAGLLHRVSLATADGVEFAASLPDGVDFVLVDYGIPAFAPAFAELRERLAPGCIVFVDGGPAGYWDSDAVRGFKAALEDDPGFLVAVLPMRKDQLIAVRVGEE